MSIPTSQPKSSDTGSNNKPPAHRRLSNAFPGGDEVSLNALAVQLLDSVIGHKAMALSKLDDRLYTATEAGASLGASSNKIGRLAAQNKLRGEFWGQMKGYHNFSCAKEVKCFHYNKKALLIMERLLNDEKSLAQLPNFW